MEGGEIQNKIDLSIARDVLTWWKQTNNIIYKLQD